MEWIIGKKIIMNCCVEITYVYMYKNNEVPNAETVILSEKNNNCLAEQYMHDLLYMKFEFGAVYYRLRQV